KTRAPEHLLGDQPLEPHEVELHRLRRPREVVDAEDDVLLVAAHVREDPRVVGGLRLVRPQPEDGMLLPQRDEPPQPAKKRGRRPLTRFSRMRGSFAYSSYM